jgi:hypothetical protein
MRGLLAFREASAFDTNVYFMRSKYDVNAVVLTDLTHLQKALLWATYQEVHKITLSGLWLISLSI